MSERYKVVFWGSPDFALPTLEAVYANAEVLGVITQPDKARGRGHEVLPTSVKAKALKSGLRVFSPESLRKECVGRHETLNFLEKAKADFFVVVAYGNILPANVLSMPRLACVNVHASLLPRWRGASPIQRAIESGDRETGVSLQKIVVELDAGDVLMEARTPISENENALQLSTRLSRMGAKMLDEFLKKDFSSMNPRKQDPTCVTFAPKISKEEAQWKETWSSEEFHNRVRAFRAWPIVRMKWPLGEKEGVEIKILETLIHRMPLKNAFEIKNDKAFLRTASLDTCIEIVHSQVPGKGPTSGAQTLKKLLQ